MRIFESILTLFRKTPDSQAILCTPQYLTHSSNQITSIELRDNGIKKVIDNEKPEWLNSFKSFLLFHAMKSDTFKIEDVRRAWEAAGGEKPHHHNVYGGIAKWVEKQQYIMVIGHGPSSSLKTHGHHVRIYKYCSPTWIVTVGDK